MYADKISRISTKSSSRLNNVVTHYKMYIHGNCDDFIMFTLLSEGSCKKRKKSSTLAYRLVSTNWFINSNLYTRLCHNNKLPYIFSCLKNNVSFLSKILLPPAGNWPPYFNLEDHNFFQNKRKPCLSVLNGLKQ